MIAASVSSRRCPCVICFRSVPQIYNGIRSTNGTKGFDIKSIVVRRAGKWEGLYECIEKGIRALHRLAQSTWGRESEQQLAKTRVV